MFFSKVRSCSVTSEAKGTKSGPLSTDGASR
jgi:hypothetical protein